MQEEAIVSRHHLHGASFPHDNIHHFSCLANNFFSGRGRKKP